jgi:ABC-type multidrug transport system ATPase subunit
MPTAIAIQPEDTRIADTRQGLRIDVSGLGHVAGRAHRVLDGITFSVSPGELVAIVGGSGAGKSTLLDAVAGIRPAAEGCVAFDGVDADEHRAAFRTALGYVPQDDIIHRDLTVEATLRYAARLRLPEGTSIDAIDAAVASTLATLDLEHRAGVRVAALSGGQRKRVCIGVELVTAPRAFFLDEPTSGLDPATAAGLMRTLRRLADQGSTVVLTTHGTDDLRHCDRVLFLAPGGRLAFDGAPDEALGAFGVRAFADIYDRVAGGASVTPARRANEEPAGRMETPPTPAAPAVRQGDGAPRALGPLRQWAVLSRRNVDLLRSSRLTLAIMLGSPILVIAMFATLFDPGAFNPVDPHPSSAMMITYWMAFAGFFFGLTYGLLQVVTELPILRRERFVHLRVGPYLLAKVAVLLPVLLGVNVFMLVVLRALDRLPDASAATYVGLTVTLMLDALAALALGLLASAAVGDPAQATLALPMLCFPAVLFSGGVLAVRSMALPGELLSLVTLDRWAFEGLGAQLDLPGRLSGARAAGGPAFLAEHGGAFSGSVLLEWLVLAAFSVLLLAAAARMIDRRTGTS